MTDKRLRSVSTPTRMLTTLRELIAALDRRVPRVDRADEVRIAGDAQRLRREAVTRIEELKRAGSDANAHDQELVEAIMTDDGGPPPSILIAASSATSASPYVLTPSEPRSDQRRAVFHFAHA